MNKQKRKVEWSFDFENMGDRFRQFFSDIVGDEVEVKSAELFAPRDGASSARIEIGFSVGKASLTALAADSDNLFEARINYIGEYEFEVSGGAERVVSLRQKGPLPRGIGRIIGKDKELHWDIALAPNTPYQLSVTGGIGETDIDLSNLLVDAIKLDTGVGKVALTMPAQDKAFAASIDGGVGKTDVVIPAGSGGKLDINGGVGEVTVTVAADAALRLMADAGIAKVNLPKSLTRVKGGERFAGISGVWESANFAEAETQIIIDFDGGVGSFSLEHFDIH
ncbi:MAG: hypothetical protein OXG68_05860 [Chloroflexi bacterium]|nr:hypothetical protein [Chloroflexota bacterium]